MRIRLGVRVVQMVAVTAFLLAATVGCGAKKAEQKPVATSDKAEAPAKAEPSKAARPATEHPAASATQAPNRVRLVDKGCVQFEPHWTTIATGQSLTWTSELKTPVTIHVAAGAFDKTEFIVRPGGVVSSGPARGPGSFSIWTAPAACQGIARGVQGSGPGVKVVAAQQ